MVSGGGTNLQKIIDACEAGIIPALICLVVSSNANAFAIERAKKHGIPTTVIAKKDYDTITAYDKAKHEALSEVSPDVIVLAGYLSILPKQTIKAFKNRIVNTHPALIPAFCGMGYYGQRVHHAVIDAGAKESGCTVHLVEEGVDTGPIILQEKVPVLEGDTAVSLAERILPVEHRLLVQAVKLMCENRIEVNEHRVLIKE